MTRLRKIPIWVWVLCLVGGVLGALEPTDSFTSDIAESKSLIWIGFVFFFSACVICAVLERLVKIGWGNSSWQWRIVNYFGCFAVSVGCGMAAAFLLRRDSSSAWTGLGMISSGWGCILGAAVARRILGYHIPRNEGERPSSK